MTPQDYIDECRTWVGTVFKHRGRVRGGGVDCIGVVYESARAVGLLPFGIVPSNYSRDPDGVELMAGLQKHMHQIRDKKQMQPGDVLLFRFLRYPQHVGVFTGRNVIHAYSKMGKCIEHNFDERWRKRLVAVFRFKEFMK